MVYNYTISVAKANKHHSNKRSEKLSSSGGDNKLRAYLVSASDYVVDINEDTISNRNGDTVFNSNVNMDVAA